MSGSDISAPPKAFFAKIASAFHIAYEDARSVARVINRPRIPNEIQMGMVEGINMMIELRPELRDAFKGQISFPVACDGIASGRMWSILARIKSVAAKNAVPQIPDCLKSTYIWNEEMGYGLNVNKRTEGNRRTAGGQP